MTELRYGYTLADVEQIARYAAITSYGRSTAMDDRLRDAWYGVVEYLYAAEHWPSSDKLTDAGRRAVAADLRAMLHHYGVATERAHDGPGSMPAYQRYWCAMASPPPDAAVTERLAVEQIMPRLQPRERRVLAALAAHDTYQDAAAALGMPYQSFATAVSEARRRFLKLWHQGEKPSRVWRIDRRVNGHGEARRRSTPAQLRARRRSYARTRAAARAEAA